jgi:hypothetical protein
MNGRRVVGVAAIGLLLVPCLVGQERSRLARLTECQWVIWILKAHRESNPGK